MKVVFLKHDGRCQWFQNNVLKKLYPNLINQSRNPYARKAFIIVDWISNDRGRVGVDLKWFKKLKLNAVAKYTDLPFGTDFQVVNTGYDSIIEEETELRERGISIIDKPCPYVRKIREAFLENDNNWQYVFLCEPNHIVVKNYASIFPKNMVMVQMDNYKDKIKTEECGKPFYFIPYSTFLAEHIEEICGYLRNAFPLRQLKVAKTQCMWANSKCSPINEIRNLDQSVLDDIDVAFVIATKGTRNKSVDSLVEILTMRGVAVKVISCLKEFKQHTKQHKNGKVLLVRSPIPNTAEKPIVAYIKHGMIAALFTQMLQNKNFQALVLGTYNRILYCLNYLVGYKSRGNS